MNTMQEAGVAGAWGMTARAVVPKIPLALLALVPVVFLITVIIGVVRWYSPIAYWDMWDGFIDFYLALREGTCDETP